MNPVRIAASAAGTTAAPAGKDASMSEDRAFSYDVFVSYSSADKVRVRLLAQRLRHAGIVVWFDEWTIQPGDDIYLAVERGLELSRTLLLCLSPAALGSDWVGLERSTGLFRDPSNAGRRFIPILLEPCILPATLQRYKYIDLRDESETGFAELLVSCKAVIRKRRQELVSSTREDMLLQTRKDLPQWADFKEMELHGGILRQLSCQIRTESPYFRFGFKLLSGGKSRLFGDGSIKSQDSTNLLVHIGRNNWDRPHLGITAQDIFVSFDVNGLRLEADKLVCTSQNKVCAQIQLLIDTEYVSHLRVNGVECLCRVVPPEICRRIVVLAWGDAEEYAVWVENISVLTASSE